MKDIFISTTNYNRFKDDNEEVFNSARGIDMIAVIGPPGRGKSTAMERFATVNQHAVCVRFQEWFSTSALLREIAFAIGGTRPRFAQTCFEIIQEELARRRKILIVDEADRMTLKHLNMLRDIHDRCHCVVTMIGEEPLRSKLAQERRIKSRVRREITFGPISQADVLRFYGEALEKKITPEMSSDLARHAEGDFRFVVKDALEIERIMKANNLKEITHELVKQVMNEPRR